MRTCQARREYAYCNSEFQNARLYSSLDLILERGKRRLAFEFKASAAPQLSKGFFGVLEALHPAHTWVVCPMDGEGYSLREGVKVAGIGEMLRDLRQDACVPD